MEFDLQNPREATTNNDSTDNRVSTISTAVSQFEVRGHIQGNEQVINSDTVESDQISAGSDSEVSTTNANTICHYNAVSTAKAESTSSTTTVSRLSKMSSNYSMRSPAVKRLLREAQELHLEQSADFHAAPLEDNLFEWHFTIRGPSDSDFAQGLYHGRIILPPEYPMKPPSIMMLTPNGRFETGTKICLSISNYHPETWRPSWSIRTALMALIGFMANPSPGAIGSIECSSDVRKNLARKSKAWVCPECGPIVNNMKPMEEMETVGDSASLNPPISDIPATPPPHEINASSSDTATTSTVLQRRQPTLQERFAAMHRTNTSHQNIQEVRDEGDRSIYNIVIGVLIVAIIALVARRLYMTYCE